MRLFVALRPPPEVLAHAEAAVAPVRERHPDLRFVPVERWHLTLAFYGEIPDDNVAGVIDMVGRKLRDAPRVRLSFAGAGVFARRALWLGVSGEVPALRRVARAVTYDRRPYRPHLTLARLRGGVDAGAAAAELAGYAGPSWVAESVELVRSRLGPRPVYEDVASWPLRQAQR